MDQKVGRATSEANTSEGGTLKKLVQSLKYLLNNAHLKVFLRLAALAISSAFSKSPK